MHCAICDREDDLISYDKANEEFTPCTVCQAVIEETIDGYEEIRTESKPAVDNTEFRPGDRVYREGVEPQREA